MLFAPLQLLQKTPVADPQPLIDLIVHEHAMLDLRSSLRAAKPYPE